MFLLSLNVLYLAFGNQKYHIPSSYECFREKDIFDDEFPKNKRKFLWSFLNRSHIRTTRCIRICVTVCLVISSEQGTDGLSYIWAGNKPF